MSYPDPDDRRAEAAVLFFLATLLFLMSARPARAEIISELGMGYKLPTTSVVMQEDCHAVTITETRPHRPDIFYRPASCGGDNPVFIGWPIAWQKDFGLWTVRAGWFHLSHWFDGGSDRELHMDAAAVTFTVNWSELRRRRRK